MAFDTAALDVATIGQGITLLSGDCRTVLPTLAANSVQCVVTSPPYYGLRDYGVAGQIGLEATPDEFIAQMVAVFREVRRVLRAEGTLWLNLGDSYSGGVTGRNDMDDATLARRAAQYGTGRGPGAGPREPARQRPLNGAKPKDLLMMPARVALALQADGWWLRSAIVWSKPNPMPESCRDRPTSAYEMVYLLAKRSRYYYDADAVREECTQDEEARTFRGGSYVGGEPSRRDVVGNRRVEVASGRNLRNVWTIATSPFSAAHFATFPPELAERCIKAGTSERGCCAACGAPWVRVTDSHIAFTQRVHNHQKYGDDGQFQHQAANRHRDGHIPGQKISTTTGWAPTCTHDAAVVPCTVLDPFAGAGTTLLVADRLQRNAIGIELNTAYTTMAMERCRADAPLFSSWPPAEDPADQRMAADAKQRDLFAC